MPSPECLLYSLDTPVKQTLATQDAMWLFLLLLHCVQSASFSITFSYPTMSSSHQRNSAESHLLREAYLTPSAELPLPCLHSSVLHSTPISQLVNWIDASLSTSCSLSIHYNHWEKEQTRCWTKKQANKKWDQLRIHGNLSFPEMASLQFVFPRIHMLEL